MKGPVALSVLAAAIGSVTASPTPTIELGVAKRSDPLPAVSASGNAFYAGGKRFYIRGIDYQPGGSSSEADPLADASVCKRDIKNFQDLGVNTVRVYAVDNSANHDECMQALNDAGIYLVLDVNSSKYSLRRDDPHKSYNAAYLQSIFATIEVFAKYSNTAAFFSGNEVVNDQPETVAAAPYIKAVTRDMKNYISSRGLRKIPVGYSAADVSSNREQLADYFNCGSDDMRSDFFAFNDYSWCNSDFQTAGWDTKVKHYQDYGIPIFLSEYGCIKNGARKFGEVEALMSDKMTSVYSGGIAYEYSVEQGNEGYGIVKIDGDNTDPQQPEFDNFKSALSSNPTPTGDGGAATTTKAATCPTKNSDFDIDTSLVPEMPSQADKYMKDGAGNGPGLKGAGSQENADSGTATASTTGGVASPTASGQQDNNGNAATPMSRADFAPIFVSAGAILFAFVGALL